MRFLLSLLFQLVLLAVITFGFVVLFEHGPAKFSEGAKTEWNALLFFVGSVLSKQEKAPARAAAQPAATQAPAPASTNSPPPKAAQTGPGTNQPAKGTPPPNR